MFHYGPKFFNRFIDVKSSKALLNNLETFKRKLRTILTTKKFWSLEEALALFWS